MGTKAFRKLRLSKYTVWCLAVHSVLIPYYWPPGVVLGMDNAHEVEPTVHEVGVHIRHLAMTLV